MKISFHGAAKDVTGSCFLLETKNTKILIDCGMFQGGSELSDLNNKPFGFNPRDINYLLLSHAHLDHCGRIPLLVRRGFRGEIITTSASRELVKLVLLDSARLHEEEIKRKHKLFKRHFKRKKSKKFSNDILYGTQDVLYALDFFGKNAMYEKPIKLSNDITATFIDAGHILGSASILLEVTEGERKTKVLFSGDIGNLNKPIVNDPALPPEVDIVVMETTYGDRDHRPIAESVKELYGAINDTFKRGGNVFIPTFALERAQELLFYFREGITQNKLSKHMQVFLDSPMAVSATEIYKRNTEFYDYESLKLFKSKNDPFYFPNLHFTREAAESMAINSVKNNAIIMAGSGMCTGGRICHHLKHNLWREECSIIFVSFAVGGTLARKIIDGAKKVFIYGEEINVGAKIYTINGFSAHAGKNELLKWYKSCGNPKITFLAHGSPESMSSMAAELRSKGKKVKIPNLHEEFTF